MPGGGGPGRDALWRASPEDPRGEEAGEKEGAARGSGRRRPPDPPGPHTRGEDARSHTRPSLHEGRSAPVATACGNEGEGHGRAPPPPLRTPNPRREPARPGGPGSRAGEPRPGPHRGRPTRPQAPARPPAPEGRGTPGGEDTATDPREADRGTRPALGRAHRSGGRGGGCWGWGGGWGGHGCSPSPSPRRRRRTGGGGKAGNGSGAAAGPGKRDTPGRGPGEQQMGSGPRRTDGRDRQTGAPTGCGHVTPTPRNRRWRRGWPRATARGMARNDPGEASRPLGRTVGSHRQRPTSTRAVPRHTQNDRLASPATPPPPRGGGRGAHPSRGLTSTAT